MPKKKTLSVYPNPFIHLDHDGYPAGACQCDMIEHVGLTSRRWVGARLDTAQTMLLEKLSPEERQYRDPRQQTRFTFDFSQPTEIVETEYYKDRIRHGEIIPADLNTHIRAGLQMTDYLEPKVVLMQSKAAAIKQRAAELGTDELPEFVDVFDAAISTMGSSTTPAAQPSTTAPGNPQESVSVPTPDPITPKAVKGSRGV